MKHRYQRLMFLLMAMALAFVHSSAQIVLHEATDITQTKATLSADFPNVSAQHGFQYKYGSLPELSEFSKNALSTLSDPVNITTKGAYKWSARPAKGWVESCSDVPVGKESGMSIAVDINLDSEISFEWSVDSEEEVGQLSLVIDGNTVQSISGLIEFRKVSYKIPAGEHTIAWIYKKTKMSNVGLDLGMVRNICIYNTTPGEWLELSEREITNLYPSQSYLYRAYERDSAGRYSHSVIKQFETKAITSGDISLSSVTQTTAELVFNPDFGDANVVLAYDISGNTSYSHPEFFKYLLDDSTYGCQITTDSDLDLWSIRSDSDWECVSSSGNRLSVQFVLDTPSEITFEMMGRSFNAYCSPEVTVDGNTDRFNGQSTAKPNNFFKRTYSLEAGAHTISWYGGAKVISLDKIYYGDIYIRRLSIPGLKKFLIGHVEVDCTHSPLTLRETGLKPDTKYYVQSQVRPNYQSELPYKWDVSPSEQLVIYTKPLIAQPLGVTEITQSGATLTGMIDGGDALIECRGLQFRKANSKWSDIAFGTTDDILSQRVSRLSPGTQYEMRCYVKAFDCDTTYSDVMPFETLAVEPMKPTIIRLSQHEVHLKGEVVFGDAVIYQRGMQFRKKGTSEWEEVEDGGDGESYTLVKKNLEMGATYEARTYVQPAGCDVIYSDVLEFTTLDSYFTKCNSNERTQTSVTFMAVLSVLDEDINVDKYGFEYYIDSDGFFENAESFVKSEVYNITVTPVENEMKVTVNGLCPSLGIRWRTYVEIDGVKNYYTGSKSLTWNYAGTERATIKATLNSLTQTTICLMLDATQSGDAVISGIEYALANSLEETGPYIPCGTNLTINGLAPDKKYNLRFRGTVNGRLCPLLKELEWDYSWFEYQTLPVAVDVVFSEITQTKAKMKVILDSGDANVTNLRYRIGYGEIMPCPLESVLTGLCPGQSYRVTIFANVNGEELSWTADASGNTFEFKAKSVYVGSTCRDISQTSAVLGISTNVGDASFVSSGIECGNKVIQASEDGNYRINELTPNTKYYYRSFVETEEGGKAYSSQNSFTTKAISCVTDKVENISNRSATMNGEIECDTYSSAEFGFQWKQMVGWQSAPAFTKGVKRDDGTISVALVNGMLEPNTDYQYRTAVRYHDEFYTSNDWQTFRTESEFVYYPATVYTVFRTDRENNALVLCGYYVAGSETIVSQGYEYWRLGYNSVRMEAPAQVLTVTTDESMQHVLMNGELQNGNYAVRAFVKTESGEILYGATLGFSVSENGYSGMDNLDVDDVEMFVAGDVLRIVNGRGLSCFVYTLNGTLVAEKLNMGDYEEIRLNRNSVYIAKLSNGKVLKVRM